MIDWNLIATIAGGGFGVTIFVLVILSLVVWISGLIIQRFQSKGRETMAKDK